MTNNSNSFTLEEFIIISIIALVLISLIWNVFSMVFNGIHNLLFGGNYGRQIPINVNEYVSWWNPASPACVDDYFESCSPNELFPELYYSYWRPGMIPERAGIDPNKIPMEPKINNLDALLEDIYIRFVAIRQDDFSLYYNVFCELFKQMQEKMKEVDPYYRKYSSRKQFAGSHFDNLRINKPDEFDMDIVISLPLDFDENKTDSSTSDIVFEPKHAAFTQLRMGKQYQKLPYRDQGEWEVNKTAYKWRDDKDYLLCNKFVDWFKGVVVQALNLMGERIRVNGTVYTVRRSESGPAITIKVSDSYGFNLDVDFVPALKFPETRWPISRAYRKITPEHSTGDWMLVPKPNKAASISQEVTRCWRIALHNQEKKIIHGSYNLKQTIRLIRVMLMFRYTNHNTSLSLLYEERILMLTTLLKKLRDSQQMHAIASYYIKTLFLWEIEKQTPSFWRSSLSTLFKHMVLSLREAVVAGNIPYYWNKNNNLIAGVSSTTLMQYRSKLDKLIGVLNDNTRFKEVAKYLLNDEEYLGYKMNILKI